MWPPNSSVYRKPWYSHPVLILIVPHYSLAYRKPCHPQAVLIFPVPHYSSVYRKLCPSKPVLDLPVPQYSSVYRRPCHSKAVLFLPGPGHQHSAVRRGGWCGWGRRLNIVLNLYRNKQIESSKYLSCWKMGCCKLSYLHNIKHVSDWNNIWNISVCTTAVGRAKGASKSCDATWNFVNKSK